ncbi:hypothetical protein [Burkholderia sp. 3C]
MEFVNPFANEGDVLPVDQLSSRIRGELSEYCKYRFGIVDADTESLTRCQINIEKELL